MIRAQYKNEEYFDKYIYDQENRIAKFCNVLNNIPRNEVEKISKCKGIISTLYIDLIAAKYSIGLSKDEIQNDVQEFFDHITGIGSYNEMINLLSLAILFDINLSKFDTIIDDNEYDDALVIKLKSYLGKKNLIDSEKLEYPNYSKPFYDFLCSRIGIDEFIEYMNEKWYDSCKDLSFYESHNGDNQTYTGYWCWLAAAILKVKSIKVESKYIPIDLV